MQCSSRLTGMLPEMVERSSSRKSYEWFQIDPTLAHIIYGGRDETAKTPRETGTRSREGGRHT
jgi:hypothetical protein